MSGCEPAIRQFQIWTEFWRITGQGIQQDGMDKGENGSGRANTEG